MTFIFFNAPKDIELRREHAHERDLAVWGLLGAVRAIVDGAKFPYALSAEWRVGQLAKALALAEERIAEADAKHEAAMAAWRAEALTDPENDVRGI